MFNKQEIASVPAHVMIVLFMVHRCSEVRRLLEHHKYCTSPQCLLCGPVNQFANEDQDMAMAQTQKYFGCSLGNGSRPSSQWAMKPDVDPHRCASTVSTNTFSLIEICGLPWTPP